MRSDSRSFFLSRFDRGRPDAADFAQDFRDPVFDIDHAGGGRVREQLHQLRPHVSIGRVQIKVGQCESP